MLVQFEDRAGAPELTEAQVAAVVAATLGLFPEAQRRVGVLLLDDEAMADLNWRHLRHEGTTDVITFTHDSGPAWEEDPDEPEVEIAVGWQVAVLEGEAIGHGPVAEALFYIAHGVLHGLGYEDDTAAQRAEMHRLQREALGTLGIAVGD